MYNRVVWYFYRLYAILSSYRILASVPCALHDIVVYLILYSIKTLEREQFEVTRAPNIHFGNFFSLQFYCWRNMPSRNKNPLDENSLCQLWPRQVDITFFAVICAGTLLRNSHSSNQQSLWNRTPLGMVKFSSVFCLDITQGLNVPSRHYRCIDSLGFEG